MRARPGLLAAVGVLGATALSAPTAAAAPDARLTVVAGGFRVPVFVTSDPADANRLFVVERFGRVSLVEQGRRRRTPFLDLRRQVRSGNEQGLLSLAFAPDYARSGRFYVFFTNRDDDVRVVELRRSARDPDRADLRTARTLIAVERTKRNHYGGQLQFGPDGLLYISLGDGGCCGDPFGNAQRLSSLNGKILRIDPRGRSRGRAYGIPRSNPFRGRRGARPEVFAYGLRNPWRFSFDRETGDFAAGDVGQDRIEEIDFTSRSRLRGANFGWSVFEGRGRFRGGHAPGHVAPVLEKSHAAGWCAIVGGVFVRDERLPRSLRGRYLYGDFCLGAIRSARLAPGRARGDSRTGLSVPVLSSFGEDAAGRVYATSLRGQVFRLDPR